MNSWGWRKRQQHSISQLLNQASESENCTGKIYMCQPAFYTSKAFSNSEKLLAIRHERDVLNNHVSPVDLPDYSLEFAKQHESQSLWVKKRQNTWGTCPEKAPMSVSQGLRWDQPTPKPLTQLTPFLTPVTKTIPQHSVLYGWADQTDWS